MTKEEMTEMSREHFMDLTGEAWRKCEFAKEEIYSCIPNNEADEICSELYEAQLIITRVRDKAYSYFKKTRK